MPVQIDSEDYLTASEVADLAGITRQILWRWRQDEKVPRGHKYRDHQVVFSEDDTQAILAYANRIEPIDPDPSQLRLFTQQTP